MCVVHAAATRRKSRCGAPTLFQAAPALTPQSAPSLLTRRKPRKATRQAPRSAEAADVDMLLARPISTIIFWQSVGDFYHAVLLAREPTPFFARISRCWVACCSLRICTRVIPSSARSACSRTSMSGSASTPRDSSLSTKSSNPKSARSTRAASSIQLARGPCRRGRR